MKPVFGTIRQIWRWLDRVATRRAGGSSRIAAQDITLRRREVMRRAAARIGVY